MKRFFFFLFLIVSIPTCFAQSKQVGTDILPTFTVSEIPDSVFALMQGKSYPKRARIARSDLRYLQLSHYDAKGNTHIGEMVCHKLIAKQVVAVFRELYEARYAIERMQLIDRFDADDERSMRANNTSCFNYRMVAGTNRLSAHAQGMAIDLNPFYNPYVRNVQGKRRVDPQGSEPYADRRKSFPYKIDKEDLAFKLFFKYGFRWGGSWRYSKDYQHFEASF